MDLNFVLEYMYIVYDIQVSEIIADRYLLLKFPNWSFKIDLNRFKTSSELLLHIERLMDNDNPIYQGKLNYCKGEII